MKKTTIETAGGAAAPCRGGSRLRGWGVLIFSLSLIWCFALVIGPWAQHHIPLMDQIVEIADERGIDMGAYFYTEIEASYNGERYLKGALDLSAPGEAALTLPFVSAIVFCLVLLGIGYRYLPLD